MSGHDVFSFGVVASSIHYAIRGPFPRPEGCAEIDGVSHVIGGEAATDIQLDAEMLAALDKIFPGPEGAAPEAYAW